MAEYYKHKNLTYTTGTAVITTDSDGQSLATIPMDANFITIPVGGSNAEPQISITFLVTVAPSSGTGTLTVQYSADNGLTWNTEKDTAGIDITFTVDTTETEYRFVNSIAKSGGVWRFNHAAGTLSGGTGRTIANTGG